MRACGARLEEERGRFAADVQELSLEVGSIESAEKPRRDDNMKEWLEVTVANDDGVTHGSHTLRYYADENGRPELHEIIGHHNEISPTVLAKAILESLAGSAGLADQALIAAVEIYLAKPIR